jgi:hypothetical protein
VVHQNHEEEKNPLGFFDLQRVFTTTMRRSNPHGSSTGSNGLFAICPIRETGGFSFQQVWSDPKSDHPARIRQFKKKVLSRKPISKVMIGPLAPAQPPSVAGAHMMPHKCLYNNSLHFCVRVIRDYRNWGASVAGKELSHQRRLFPEGSYEFFRPKPLERQVPVNDFFRAKKNAGLRLHHNDPFHRGVDPAVI